MDIDVSLKGIGISFIDNLPKELIFLTIDDIFLQYNTHKVKELLNEALDGQNSSKEEDDMTEVRESIMLKIGNLQIDNLINDEFPVLFGAAKYYDKKLIRKSTLDMKSRLQDFYMMTEDRDARISASAVKRKQAKNEQKEAQKQKTAEPGLELALDVQKLEKNQQVQDGDDRAPFLFF